MRVLQRIVATINQSFPVNAKGAIQEDNTYHVFPPTIHLADNSHSEFSGQTLPQYQKTSPRNCLSHITNSKVAQELLPGLFC